MRTRKLVFTGIGAAVGTAICVAAIIANAPEASVVPEVEAAALAGPDDGDNAWYFARSSDGYCEPSAKPASVDEDGHDYGVENDYGSTPDNLIHAYKTSNIDYTAADTRDYTGKAVVVGITTEKGPDALWVTFYRGRARCERVLKVLLKMEEESKVVPHVYD